MKQSTIIRCLFRLMLAAVMVLGPPGQTIWAAQGAQVRPLECARPPAPIRSLQLPRYYKDKAGTIIDKGAKARHKRMVRPLVVFVRNVASNADKSVRRRKLRRARVAADCALYWLTSWARGGALTGDMATKQGDYQRKWDMTGIALSYLKLRRFAAPSQRAVIEPWLRQLGDRARAFFDDSGRRRNNHWYWLGLGLGAVGLGTNSPRHWQMAKGVMQDAARDVGPDGTLAHELKRGKLALKYHAFSVMPLVVLAELAAARGENWYRLNKSALHRLVARTVSGLQDPMQFERLAGKAQKRPIKPGAGWAQLYQARFPKRSSTLGPMPRMKPGHRWLGGRTELLARMLTGYR